jgi:hypothetical protein
LIFENRKDAVIRPRLSQKIKIDRPKNHFAPVMSLLGLKLKNQMIDVLKLVKGNILAKV